MAHCIARLIPVALLGATLALSGCTGTKSTPATAEKHEAREGHSDHEGEAGHAGESAHAEEGRIHFTAEAMREGGLEVRAAVPALIRVTRQLPGEVVANADRLAHIVPRFPGIAKRVVKNLGDSVVRDEVLAIVESNQSLASYELHSLISGTVIEKHITLGEFVRDDADVFVIADLSTIWVNLTIYPRDLERTRTGQRVLVRAMNGTHRAEGRISYIGPILGEPTRAATARVVLPNPKRAWRPGMFVSAEVVVEERTAAIAVHEAALQTVQGRTVVFVEEESAFVARDVVPGQNDGTMVEIRSGLKAGERYLAAGGFIAKSELLKAEAGHDH